MSKKERDIVATYKYSIEVADNGYLVLDEAECNVLKTEEFAQSIGKEIENEMLAHMFMDDPGRPAFKIHVEIERYKSPISCD